MADIILNRQYNPSGFEIGPHDVVIDIGAHRGVFLGHVAVRTQAQVVGIEPDPDNFRLLALLVRRNRMKNVELVNAAVAGATGESRLYRGMASSQHTLTGVDVFTGKALPLSQSVKTISLDDLCHGYPTIHFLKMDCEGAEHGIVQSAHDDTLRKINRLVMEIHELAKPDAGKTLLDRLGHFFTRMDFKRTSDHMGLLYATRD